MQPKAVIVESSSRCQLTCMMCPQPNLGRHHGVMSLWTLKAILRGLPPEVRVGMSNWGEPLLNRQLEFLVQEAASRGHEVEMTTNGMLITRPRLDALVNAGLKRVYLSMDGIGWTYQHIRGVAFSRVEDALQLLLEARQVGLEVYLRVTLQQANEHHLEQLEHYRGLVDGISVQRRVIWDGPRRTYPCPVLQDYVVFLWDGTAVACCADYKGQLRLGVAGSELSAMDVFTCAAMERLRREHSYGNYPKTCLTCTEWPGGDETVGQRFKLGDEW